MTPRFAQAVDPILLHVFSLLERIDNGVAISPNEEKRVLTALIEDADTRLSGSPEWPLAKYALVSWIDEMLVDAHIWDGQDFWKQNVLEWTFFKSRECNELFYARAAESVSSARDDAVQMFYVCAMLGFRGLYRDPQRSRMLIDKHELSKNLEGWSKEFAKIVQEARRRHNESLAGTEIERNIVTAVPLWTRSRMVWPWLLATLAAGLNMLVYFGL